MKKRYIILGTLLAAFTANQVQAQQGFGTSTPAPSSVIDMVANNKGALLPRIALTSTSVAAPVVAPADALTVFNTATAGSGVTAVTPGYYYWSAATSAWVRLLDKVTNIEPLNVQGGSTQATTNLQDVYQTGKLAVGDFSGATSTKKFEVKGDFKSEVVAGNTAYGTEVNATTNPGGAMHYWQNNTTGDFKVASANPTSASLVAKAGTTTNTLSAVDAQATVASQNGTNSLSTLRALNTGNFFMESYNVTGNFGSTVSLQNDGLRLVHTTTGGAADPFPNSLRSELMIQKENGVRFNFRKADGTTNGEYWFPTTSGIDGQVMTQTAAGKMIWSTPAVSATEPWNVQGGTTPATANTQNIYQTGSVAIAKNAVLAGANLDVAGAVRAGAAHAGTVGTNSAAFGENNTVSGESAMAFGVENQVTQFTSGAIGFANTVTQEYAMSFGQSNKILIGTGAYGSAAFGQNNTISGSNSQVSGVSNNISGASSTAFGQNNTVTANFAQSFGYANNVGGTGSSAFGQENRTLGSVSAVFGIGNIAASPGELVLGQNNGIITSSVPSNSSVGAGMVLGGATDPIFQIGNGNATRNNAVTVLNNGSVGIGITGTEAAAKPTQRLDIGSGNVRVRDINSQLGAATDKFVVADATGILKTVATPTAVNIYNANGTLTDNRIVSMAGYNLRFQNAGTERIILNTTTTGNASLDSEGSNRGALRAIGGNTILEMYSDNNSAAQLAASGAGVTALQVGTGNSIAKPLHLMTNGIIRATVTATGEVAVGATTAPSFVVGATTIQPKFHVAGDISTTGKVWTTNSVYADYVFEKYFKGKSSLNPNYEFKSLNYVKDFIKANHHLPGVESIDDLHKGLTGYTFDITKLTVQSLEKIEELYLHTIEQQAEIDALKKEAEATKKRLDRLEQLLLQNNK